MKRYFESTILVLLSILTFTACSEDEGTSPGSDGQPHVSLNMYPASLPYDSDNDQILRMAVNQQTESVYYLAEKTADKDARGMAADAYADYVVSNGKQANLETDAFSGGKTGDVIIEGMKGDYTITAVAVSGGTKVSSSVTFWGPNWLDVTNGTYTFSARAQQRLGVEEKKSTVLQCLESDPTQYRFKNLYGVGHSLLLTLTDKTDKDDYDKLQYFRVQPQATPFTYSSYGTISVRDLGYWQDDDSYAYDPGYGCFMYTENYKNFVVVAVQYYVSAGSLGYGWDEFEPEK
jgi:hypothetical protein